MDWLLKELNNKTFQNIYIIGHEKILQEILTFMVFVAYSLCYVSEWFDAEMRFDQVNYLM